MEDSSNFDKRGTGRGGTGGTGGTGERGGGGCKGGVGWHTQPMTRSDCGILQKYALPHL